MLSCLIISPFHIKLLMKFFPLFLIGYVMASLAGHAQIANVNDDGEFSVSGIYMGMYSSTEFPIDSVASQSHVNFRLGIKSQLALSDHFMIKTWGAMQMSKNQSTAGYNAFEIVIRPDQKLSFHLGLTATPTTVLRPNPTTWESQTETHAQGTIVPGRPGSKFSYLITPNTSVTYGYFNHGEQWAHHLNISLREWHLAGYYLENGEHFMALVHSRDWLESTTTFRSGEKLSNSALLSLGNAMSLVLDCQYLLVQQEINFAQTGLRKYLESPTAHIKGFFALSYDWQAKAIMGQVFVHLF